MQGRHSLFVGAVRTAVVTRSRFGAVSNDFAAAVVAFGSQGVDRTFEAVEIMRDARNHNFQGLIVLVAAYLTSMHKSPSGCFTTRRDADLHESL